MAKRQHSTIDRYRRAEPRYALKPRFVIAMEGDSTELDYFSNLQKFCPLITIKSIRSRHHSSPKNVLHKMKAFLNSSPLQKQDQAWIVIDRDQWPEDQLLEVRKWAESHPKHGQALSNPNFEFWLLLHFEPFKGSITPKVCNERLERYLADYDKSLNERDFPLTAICQAVQRAQTIRRFNQDWPNQSGTTTVFQLVSEILRLGCE